MRLTTSQQDLFAELKTVLADGPKTTAAIRRDCGFKHQGYESYLRDRLFRLAAKGLLVVSNTSRGRFWTLA